MAPGFNRGERGWYLQRRGWLQRTDGMWHAVGFPGASFTEEEAERAQLDADAALRDYVDDRRPREAPQQRGQCRRVMRWVPGVLVQHAEQQRPAGDYRCKLPEHHEGDCVPGQRVR